MPVVLCGAHRDGVGEIVNLNGITEKLGELLGNGGLNVGANLHLSHVVSLSGLEEFSFSYVLIIAEVAEEVKLILCYLGSNPIDNQSNYEDNCGKCPTNPNGSKYPNPCPINYFTELENNEGDAEKSREAREANVNVLIFHVITLSGFVSVSLHLMYLLYHGVTDLSS